MRRSHARALRQLARRGPARLWRTGLKALCARINPEFFPPWLPPVLATIAVTGRCNLDCSYCSTHDVGAAPPDSLDLASLVDELADLGADAIGLTGGEPLLHPQIDEAIARAAARRLYVHLNTNGTLIDAGRSSDLVASGLGSINVSLDGGTSRFHDGQRGEGAFDRASAGMAHLIAARKERGSGPGLRFVMTLGGHNASSVAAFIDRSHRAGVDGCSFIPVHRSFSEPRRNASDVASRAAARLIRTAPPLVDNSRAYLRGMQAFFLGEPMPRRCSAPRTSIVVDHEGTLFPCVPAATRATQYGSAESGIRRRTKSLDEIFKSGDLRDTLDPEICSTCWWNCHRELDIGLGIL